jgi:hypothetical protein
VSDPVVERRGASSAIWWQGCRVSGKESRVLDREDGVEADCSMGKEVGVGCLTGNQWWRKRWGDQRWRRSRHVATHGTDRSYSNLAS